MISYLSEENVCKILGVMDAWIVIWCKVHPWLTCLVKQQSNCLFGAYSLSITWFVFICEHSSEKLYEQTNHLKVNKTVSKAGKWTHTPLMDNNKQKFFDAVKHPKQMKILKGRLELWGIEKVQHGWGDPFEY